MIAVLAVVLGCRTSSPDARSEVSLAALGWVADVARAPGSFTALVDEGHDGWVALHAHDYAAARDAFDRVPVGRVRADLAITELHDDLARVTTLGASTLFDAWKARGSLPDGPEAPVVAGLAAVCGGEDPSAWGRSVLAGAFAGLAGQLAAGRSPFDDVVPSPVQERLVLHAAVRSGELPARALADDADTPLLSRDEGDFRREYWDPCVSSTLAERAKRDLAESADAAGGVAALANGGLGVRLFGAWPADDDIRRVLGAGEPDALRDLGTATGLRDQLGPLTEGADDVDAAKAWLRALDRVLDQGGEQLRSTVDADGKALLHDLGLMARLRQEVVVVEARAALRRGHPRQAGALAELALDPSGEVGPLNAPALFALLAEAHLRLGRAREAMDAIQPLVVAYPFLEGTRETLGDWSVLQGLDRSGDSKESP